MPENFKIKLKEKTAQQIRKEVCLQGSNLAEFAKKRLEITPEYFSRILKGKVSISPKMMKKFNETFHLGKNDWNLI